MDGPHFTRHRGTPSSLQEDSRWGADSPSHNSAPSATPSNPGQPSPRHLFKHSRELFGGLAGQGRAQAAKSKGRFESYKTTFRDENPRLYGLLYDVCDAIAFVGWEQPFGYARDEWLSYAFVCLVASVALLIPAMVGLGLGTKGQIQDVAWGANSAYSNGLWMTPAGYM